MEPNYVLDGTPRPNFREEQLHCSEKHVFLKKEKFCCGSNQKLDVFHLTNCRFYFSSHLHVFSWKFIHTSGDIILSPWILAWGIRLQSHVSAIKGVIWLAADACLKEVEGKNEQDGRAVKAVFTLLGFVFLAVFYTFRAYKRIDHVRVFTCGSYWRHRSLFIGPRWRNWRRFVVRFVILSCHLRVMIILVLLSRQAQFDLQCCCLLV